MKIGLSLLTIQLLHNNAYDIISSRSPSHAAFPYFHKGSTSYLFQQTDVLSWDFPTHLQSRILCRLEDNNFTIGNIYFFSLSFLISLSLTFTFFCCPAHESRDRKKKQETYQSSFFRHVITELSKPLAIVNVKHHKLKCLRNCNSPENAHWVGDLHLKVPLPGRPVFHHVLVLTSLGSFSHASVQN